MSHEPHPSVLEPAPAPPRALRQCRFVQLGLPLLAALFIHAAALAAGFSVVTVAFCPVPDVPDEQTLLDRHTDGSQSGRENEVEPVVLPYQRGCCGVHDDPLRDALQRTSESAPAPIARPPVEPGGLIGDGRSPGSDTEVAWGVAPWLDVPGDDPGLASLRRWWPTHPWKGKPVPGVPRPAAGTAGTPGGGATAAKSRMFDAGDGPAPAGVVFACDAADMLASLATLKDELQKAVDGLGPGQSFNLVFFRSQSCYALDRSRLLPATAENKRKAASFLDNVCGGGTTDPVPGLQFAFSLRPRVIYLVTNGDFPDNKAVLDLVRRLNPDHETVIHTIAFTGSSDTDTDFLDLLKQVAAESGGKYRHVTEAELRP